MTDPPKLDYATPRHRRTDVWWVDLLWVAGAIAVVAGFCGLLLLWGFRALATFIRA